MHKTCRPQGQQQNVSACPKDSRRLIPLKERAESVTGAKGPSTPQQTVKFKQEKCHACGKVGHIPRACRNKSKLNQNKNGLAHEKRDKKRSSHYRSHKVHETENESKSESSEEDSFTLNCIKCRREHRSKVYKLGRFSEVHLRKVEPYTVNMKLNKKDVNFEIDTGCCLTRPIKVKLETYTGDPVKVIGATFVRVRYKQQCRKLPLVVVQGDGPSLLGRGWLEEISLDWREIKRRNRARKVHQVKTTEDTLQRVLNKHEDVFKDELGTLKGTKATIHVKQDATPHFFRPRSVPFAIRAKVDKEIDRLLKENIMSPVKYAEWAAPVVPILKPIGTVRLCGDYKLTVNTVASLEQYPIPRVDDLFAALSGGKQFSKLDMSHAYQQILLSDESKKYVTVNTH